MLVATRNAHKLSEIRDILRDVPVTFLSLSELGVEPKPEEAELERFETFVENALSKARYFHARAGLPTLADDSGLCVEALEGGPGVRTRRFAPEELAARWGRDEANNRYLLQRLEGLAEGERGAEYRCAVAVVGGAGRARPVGRGPDVEAAATTDRDTSDDHTFVSEGRVTGRIALEPRGEGGFGYDPLFVFPPLGRTFAELPEDVKREKSHRARALRGLRPWLDALIEETHR